MSLSQSLDGLGFADGHNGPAGADKDSSHRQSFSSDSIPRDFIEAYPYPAFVLAYTPRLPLHDDASDTSNARGSHSSSVGEGPAGGDPADIHTLFANSQWDHISDGKTVAEVLTREDLRLLGDWMFAAELAKDTLRWCQRFRSVDSLPSLKGRSPEDRHSLPHPLPRNASNTSERSQSHTPLTLSFMLPDIVMRFELVCTPMGPAWGNDQALPSQRIAVITTIPRGRILPGKAPSPIRCGSTDPSGRSIPPLEILQPKASRAASGAAQQLTDMELSAEEEDLESPPKPPELWTEVSQVLENMRGWQPGHALYFHRDGTVNNVMRPIVNKGSTEVPVSKLLQEYDFAQTPLGPRANWDVLSSGMVDILMLNPMAGTIWLGKDLTMVYNQSAADMMSDHPAAWGRHGSASWDHIQSLLGPLFEVVLAGIPVLQEDEQLMASYPHTENREVYGSQMWLPLRGVDGEFGCIFNGIIDTTDQVIANRRTNVLKSVGERTANMHCASEFYQSATTALAEHPQDIPFALMFTVETAAMLVHNHERSGGRECQHVVIRYVGGVGVPDEHPAAPEEERIVFLDSTGVMIAEAFPGAAGEVDAADMAVSSPLAEAHGGRQSRASTTTASTTPEGVWPFVKVLRSRQPVIVEDCSKIIDGFPVRVWQELPSSAIVVPIMQNLETSQRPKAILVLGLNPRLRFDEDYESFTQSLRLILASSLIAAEGYESEWHRLESLAALDRARSLLFSNVFHELCSPLSLIAGPLEDIVALLPPDAPAMKSLHIIQRNVSRLTRLISMLADLSRLEADQSGELFSPVNLGVVTRDLAALFRKTVTSHGLSYIVECDTTLHDVYVDRGKWEKILFNLIDNAIKHTRTGIIQVTLSYTSDQAVLSVEDTGIGVSMINSDLGGDSATSNYGDGADIALSYVKKLTQLHHGTFELESKGSPGSTDGPHGTFYRVKIPLGGQHLPPGSINEGPMSDLELATLSPRSHTSATMPWEDEFEAWNIRDSKRLDKDEAKSSPEVDTGMFLFTKDDVIMIVDDMTDSRRYMRSIFEPFCKVIEARDGQEALEKWDDDAPPNLVIADQHMGRMDGVNLLRALRNGPQERTLVPFMMLLPTGVPRPVDDEFIADDYLIKPFGARELASRAHVQLQMGKRRIGLEKAFKERTAELRVLTDLSPVGIYRSDGDGYVTYANPAWHKISGYPPGKVTDWGEYVHEDDRAQVRDKWETFVRDTSQSTIEAEYRWTNGKWVETKTIRLEAVTDGMRTGYIGCAIDITERKLMDQLQRQRVTEAEQRRAEAEEAKHQQDLLIDIASHEIRNPTSSLMQCALLVKSNLTTLYEQLRNCAASNSTFRPTKPLLNTLSEDLDALDSIYQCSLTQERISNDVLSFGRIQLNMLQFFDIEVDVVREAQRVITIFQSEARIHQIKLGLNIGAGMEAMGRPKLMLDPVRLGQVLTNLLSNAFRFTADSSVRTITLSIDVRLEAPPATTCAPQPWDDSTAASEVQPDQKAYLFAAVRDTGAGLTEAEQAKLFRRFSQASAKTHTRFGGSGLGLFVCRKICEFMNGRIEVVSEYGRGSEFRFFVETRVPPSHEAPHQKPTAIQSPVGSPASSKGMALRAHVLVVEDNHINRTVLKRQLKQEGFEVALANNGLEALEKIRSAMALNPDGTSTHYVDGVSSAPRPFDCVLMDLEMPIMDGYTAAKLVREDEAQGKLAASPIIALTGNARHAMIESAMTDFTDVMIKPYRLDALVSMIHKYQPDY